LRLVFTETDQELIDKEEDEEVKVKVLIQLFKNPKNNLCASVELLESTLNEFYASQIMRFI